MSVHIVLEKLGQIPSQRLEFRPPVRIGVPTPGYHSEQLASTVRRPLQSITVLHVPHHFPCRHVRVRCRTCKPRICSCDEADNEINLIPEKYRNRRRFYNILSELISTFVETRIRIVEMSDLEKDLEDLSRI